VAGLALALVRAGHPGSVAASLGQLSHPGLADRGRGNAAAAQLGGMLGGPVLGMARVALARSRGCGARLAVWGVADPNRDVDSLARCHRDCGEGGQVLNGVASGQEKAVDEGQELVEVSRLDVVALATVGNAEEAHNYLLVNLGESGRIRSLEPDESLVEHKVEKRLGPLQRVLHADGAREEDLCHGQAGTGDRAQQELAAQRW